MNERKFVIQEQAPAGNYFDSIGLDGRLTFWEALEKYRAWRDSFCKARLTRYPAVPGSRLVLRMDAVVEAHSAMEGGKS